MKKTLVVFSIFLITSSYGQKAFKYDSRASGMALGKSFDLFDPSISFAQPIFSNYDIQTNDHTSSEVYFYVLQNLQSFDYSSLSNISLGASILCFASADYTNNNYERSLTNANSLTICLMGKTDYGNFTVSHATLSPNFKEALKNPNSVRQQYGEFYVSGVHKEQAIYLYITINNIDASHSQQIINSLGVSATASPFSASARASLNTALSSYISSKNLALSVKVLGKSDISSIPLNSVCSNFYSKGDLSGNSYQGLLNYMNTTFNVNNSSVTEYYYSPLSQFGYKDNNYFFNMDEKLRKYLELLKEYINQKITLNYAQSIMSFNGYALHSYLDEVFLKGVTNDIEDNLSTLATSINRCNNDSCNPPAYCCNKPTLNNINKSKLSDDYQFFQTPLEEISWYQNNSATLFLNPPLPGQSYYNVLIGQRMGNKFSSYVSNLTNNNIQLNYTINTDVYFKNEFNVSASFQVVTYVNDQIVISQTVSGNSGDIIHANQESQSYSVNQLFNGVLPNRVDVRVFMNQCGVNNTNFSITVLPNSKTIFNF